MKQKYSKAFVTSIQLWEKYLQEGKPVKKKENKTSNFTHERTEVREFNLVVPGDYAYVNSIVFKDLSNPAILIVAKIMVELKMNNPLWYYDHTTNTYQSGIITELKKKDILLKTDDVRIHFVNPFLIRKGDLGDILQSTIILLGNSSRVTTDHIKPLRYTSKKRIHGFDFLNAE